jgi:hypothetical protein
MFAAAGLAPQVCVGIDMRVPAILSDLGGVSIVQPDDKTFVQVLRLACENPSAGGAPIPAPVS